VGRVQDPALLAAVPPMAVGLILLCIGQFAHYLPGWRLAAWDVDRRATGPAVDQALRSRDRELAAGLWSTDLGHRPAGERAWSRATLAPAIGSGPDIRAPVAGSHGAREL